MSLVRPSRGARLRLGRFEFEGDPRSFMDIESWYGDPWAVDIASPSISRHASVRYPRPLVVQEKEKELPEPPPPDGGLLAWTQVFTAFLLVMNGFGYINSFGVYQEAYVEMIGRSTSEISFVGSFQIFLLYFVGTLSGRALDAGYFRVLIYTGCGMQILGIFTTASATQYWQLFLAQGIVQGLGNGMLFTPLVWLVSTYFTKKRGLALGLASCGAPIGGIVFPLVARQLVPQIGFQWTVRVMGFLVLFNSLVIAALIRPRPVKRIKGPLLDLAAFRDKPYTFYCIGIFFALWGLYWAPIYITIFVKEVLGGSSSTSLEVLMILNGLGVTGRLIPPAIADRFQGPLRILTLCTLFSALFLYWWIAVHTLTGVIVWCVLYAFWTNAIQTLFTASIGVLTSDFSKLGVRIGMVFTIISFACLSGPPLAGALVSARDGDFLYAQVFGGSSMFVGFVFMVAACLFQAQADRS